MAEASTPQTQAHSTNPEVTLVEPNTTKKQWKIVTVKVPVEMLEEIDRAVARLGYRHRGTMIKDAIKAFIMDTKQEVQEIAKLHLQLADTLLDTAANLMKLAEKHVETAGELIKSPAVKRTAEKIADAHSYTNMARIKLKQLL